MSDMRESWAKSMPKVVKVMFDQSLCCSSRESQSTQCRPTPGRATARQSRAAPRTPRTRTQPPGAMWRWAGRRRRNRSPP